MLCMAFFQKRRITAYRPQSTQATGHTGHRPQATSSLNNIDKNRRILLIHFKMSPYSPTLGFCSIWGLQMCCTGLQPSWFQCTDLIQGYWSQGDVHGPSFCLIAANHAPCPQTGKRLTFHMSSHYSHSLKICSEFPTYCAMHGTFNRCWTILFPVFSIWWFISRLWKILSIHSHILPIHLKVASCCSAHIHRWICKKEPL